MKFIDQNGNEIDPDKQDYNLGQFKDDKLFVKHHEAVEKVEEVSHYETVRVYPNGGKDVQKVIDTPGQEAKDAYDEYEDVQRWTPYTKEELDQRAEQDSKGYFNSALTEQNAIATNYLIAAMSDKIDDNTAEQFAGLFSTFTQGTAYTNGTIVRHKTGLYRAIHDVPDTYSTTPDLDGGKYFNRIGKPNADGIYSWLQPTKEAETYTNGDLVVWKGDVWKSDVNTNAYEPGTQFWTKQ